jgi:hypothetical protein
VCRSRLCASGARADPPPQLPAKFKALYDRIGALPRDQCTFATVCLPLALQEARYVTFLLSRARMACARLVADSPSDWDDSSLETLSASLTFPQHVSPIKPVRDASEEAERLIQVRPRQSSVGLLHPKAAGI